ncbi:MAG: hypothetical protein M3R20_03240 [Pseudomonadota bacterium]|nr:hypothetical protein [Pseudomonadota bacterium]
MRAALEQQLFATLTDAFPFLGRRCVRMTESVRATLGARFADEREGMQIPGRALGEP